MHMEEFKLDNYVVVPRYIKTDYFEGKLSKPERNLLLWLRLSGSPYGIATVTMDGLANDAFNNSVDKSYINKLLLSLKSKRYVWYSERTGRRGSFEVHMGDWILPSKHIKNLGSYFDDGGVRSQSISEAVVGAEVGAELTDSSQSFVESNTVEESREKIEKMFSRVRGYDNDKEKDKNKEKESLPSLSFKEREYSFSNFKENSYEEMRCKQIAKEIGDKDVAYCVGIYRKYGLPVIERALTEFNDSEGWVMDNPPAFFNSLVQLEIESL
jgi:hypothetical protein